MKYSTSFVPLNQLVNHSKRSVKPQLMEPDRSYVLLEHIVSGTGEVQPSTVAAHSIGSNKTAYSTGDVLYGKLRPNLRKTCVVDRDGYCSTDILALTPIFENSAYYLAAILRSETFTAQVMRLVSGASLPRIGLRDLMRMEVPWPSERADLDRFNRISKEIVAVRDDIAALSSAVSLMENSFWR